MLAIFQAYVTSPAKNDLFRSEQRVGAVSIAHSFSTSGRRCSGPGQVICDVIAGAWGEKI